MSSLHDSGRAKENWQIINHLKIFIKEKQV